MIARPRRPIRTHAAPATALALALAIGIARATTGASGTPVIAQGTPLRFENVTLLAGGHHVFARLADIAEGAPPRWVEAAVLPDAGACAPPACAPDAPRAVARAATIYDGGLEFAFVTAGPFQRRPVRLAPGDRVRLRTVDGGAPAAAMWTVGEVTVTAIDTAADRLSGTGPAGAQLSVTANRPDGAFKFTSATVAADGTWTVDLAGKLDVVPGASGAVSASIEGIVTQASWSVPRAVARLGDRIVHVEAQAGDIATVWQPCGPSSLHMDRLGRGVAWRGGSEPAPIVLRDQRSGTMTPLSAFLCGPLSFGIEDRPDVATAALPVEIDIDVRSDTIRSAGSWPPGRFAVQAGGVRRIVETTAADPRWTVPLSGTLDLTTTLPVDVTALDETAPIAWSMRAYPLHVDRVDPTYVRVHGRGTAGRIVEVKVGEDILGFGTVAADGTFDVAATYEDGPLARLDGWPFIEIRQVREIRTMPGEPGGGSDDNPADAAFFAAPLHAAAVANRDVVHGTALPGARITVRVGSGAGGGVVTTGALPSGEWEADFADIADLAPGTPVAVEATADDGYRSTLTFPVFRASAQVGGDRVVVEGHPGLGATVEVTRDGDVVGRAQCTVSEVATTCTARVRGAAGDAVVMRADDEVVVLPSEGGSASLRLIPFSAHIDANARSVVGNCPPNGAVQVRFHAAEGAIAPYDASTSADGNGVCDYELSRGEWDLVQPGLSADLIHPLDDGHRLFSTGVYEHVRLFDNGPVEGLAEPFSAVTLTLRTAAGADRPLFAVRADGDGRWTTDTPVAAGIPHHPAPGETLVVEDGRRRHVLPYTPLIGWWDDPLGAVVGVAAPDQPVKVVHDLRPASAEGRTWCVGLSDFATEKDVADALGTFALAAPPADACAVGRAEIAAVLPSGDEVRYRLPTDVQPGGRAFLPLGLASRP